MASVPRVDELRGGADPVPLDPHAPLEEGADAQAPLARAARGGTLVRAGALASLSFGALAVEDTQRETRSLTVRNLDAADKRYRVEAVLAPGDAEGGVTFTPSRADLTVPGGMGCRETLERLIELDPQIKTLLSSGYSIDGQAAEILKSGCNGFIQKPFTLEALSQKIRDILDAA